ncbi:MAG: hypothetical protein Fur0010_03800 [Bdellovibrio sp.]
MSDKLQQTMNIVGDQTNIQLSGIVDEDADFSKLKGIGTKEVVFDFQKITMINSCGIREWIQSLSNLKPGIRISYINCPQIIIEQINMVQGFIPKGASVESFYAPYFCESCDKEVKILLKRSDVPQFKAPEMKCPDCGDTMDFDAIESQYFNFLKQG